MVTGTTTGTIYVIRNKKSNKEFVGATTQTLSRIWNAHKSWTNKGRRSPLHDEIRRFGPDHFVIKHLQTVPVHQMREKQQSWVRLLKSTVPNGYNRGAENSGRRVYFSPKQVKQILALAEGNSQTKIAKLWGVSQATISRIIGKKTYK